LKISKSQVTKIVLTELDQLDPVTFITESLGHERGKLTIDCYGEAWTAYWGSMGCDFVEAFIRDASVDYLTNKLTKAPRTITDFDKVSKELGHEVDRDSLGFYINDLIGCYGSDWYMELPTTDNPDFVYLCRIVSAVKEAIGNKLLVSLDTRGNHEENTLIDEAASNVQALIDYIQSNQPLDINVLVAELSEMKLRLNGEYN
jgi:hypothetical protein